MIQYLWKISIRLYFHFTVGITLKHWPCIHNIAYMFLYSYFGSTQHYRLDKKNHPVLLVWISICGNQKKAVEHYRLKNMVRKSNRIRFILPVIECYIFDYIVFLHWIYQSDIVLIQPEFNGRCAHFTTIVQAKGTYINIVRNILTS